MWTKELSIMDKYNSVKLTKDGKPTKTFQKNGQPKNYKKCQPPTRDMADLIQTVHVPSWGLTRPHKKIKKQKNQKWMVETQIKVA